MSLSVRSIEICFAEVLNSIRVLHRGRLFGMMEVKLVVRDETSMDLFFSHYFIVVKLTFHFITSL